MKKTDVGTITRTILIIIALINQGLLIAGKNPLPFEDGQIAQVISFGFTAVTALIAWWKNSFTRTRGGDPQGLVIAGKNPLVLPARAGVILI